MGQDRFIPVATNARSRSDLVERGFSRQPLRVDVDIARSLEALAHAAWSVPKDKYYDEGDKRVYDDRFMIGEHRSHAIAFNSRRLINKSQAGHSDARSDQ